MAEATMEKGQPVIDKYSRTQSANLGRKRKLLEKTHVKKKSSHGGGFMRTKTAGQSLNNTARLTNT